MKKIDICEGILIYYGNPAGYLSGKKVILDSLFAKEEIMAYLSNEKGLAVEIGQGIYDQLSEGREVEVLKTGGKERRVKIYQLKQDSPIMVRFISLAERKRRGFEAPQPYEYFLVYEEAVKDFSLEDIWERFGKRVPEGFVGRTLSISDVVEFMHGEESRFFYVEPDGFAEVTATMKKSSH